MAMDTVLNLWLMGMMTLALVLFSGSFVGLSILVGKL